MATKKKRKTKKSRKSNPVKRAKRRGHKRRKNPKKKHRRSSKARRRNPNSVLLAGIVGGAIDAVITTPAAHFVGSKIHMGKSPMAHGAAKVATRVGLGLILGEIAKRMGHDNIAAGIAGGIGHGIADEAMMHFSKGKDGLAKTMREAGFGHGSHIPLPGGGHIAMHAPENGPAQITATDDEGNTSQLMGITPVGFMMRDRSGNEERGMAMAQLPGNRCLYQDSHGELNVLDRPMGEIVKMAGLGEVVQVGEIVSVSGLQTLSGEEPEVPMLEGPDDGKHGYHGRD